MLATEIFTEQLQGTAVEDITFVEHYEYNDRPQDEHYDIVSLDWDGKRFRNPQWKRTTPEQIGLDFG